MTEEDLLTAVLNLAMTAGFRVCHFRPARTNRGWRTLVQGHPGWPDLMMVKGKRFLVVELKGEKGVVSDDQRLWLADLLRAGIETHVWRPVDWTTGLIAEELGCAGGVIPKRDGADDPGF